MWKEFKQFAIKGNIMDLALGVIIGGAFGKIVTSLVNDIIMPVVGLLLGQRDFSGLYINLKNPLDTSLSLAAAKEAKIPTLNYGMFINNIIDFLIIAFSLFIVIKQLNRFKKKQEPAPVKVKKCDYCCTDIPLEAKRCPHCTSVLE